MSTLPSAKYRHPWKANLQHGLTVGLGLVVAGGAGMGIGYVSLAHPLLACAALLAAGGLGVHAWSRHGQSLRRGGWIPAAIAAAISWPVLAWAYWERAQAMTRMGRSWTAVYVLAPGYEGPLTRFLLILAASAATTGLLEALLSAALSARGRGPRCAGRVRTLEEAATVSLVVCLVSLMLVMGRGWALIGLARGA